MADATTTPDRPNVIWIFGDQHRAQALGYRGDPNVRTPNIDRLAKEGVRFDRAVSGAPWCTPFRGSLLTSRYPNHAVSRTPQRLDPALPTIATPFNDAGYHTAYVGKWHLDGGFEADKGETRHAWHIVPPERRGQFQYWMGYENNNSQYDCYLHGTDSDAPVRLDGYETDALTDVFLDHLASHLAQREAGGGYQPFFGVLSVQPPHNPYVAPEADMARHHRGSLKLRPNVPDVPWVREIAEVDLPGYYAMVENLDRNLGRVRQALRDWGIDRETHIVFFSDHGDCLGSHGLFRKSNPYEESIRIPCIFGGRGNDAHWGKVGTCDAVINHVDLAPTTLGLCGIDVPAWMTGYDYSARRNRGAAVRYDEPTSAYLQQIHRKRFPDGLDEPWRGVVTRDGWKYICLPHQRWLMFNLNDDPYEQANLALNTRFRDQRDRLHSELQAWIARTEDDFPLPTLPV